MPFNVIFRRLLMEDHGCHIQKRKQNIMHFECFRVVGTILSWGINLYFALVISLLQIKQHSYAQENGQKKCTFLFHRNNVIYISFSPWYWKYLALKMHYQQIINVMI